MRELCFDILYIFRLKQFSFQEEQSKILFKRKYIGLRVKYRYFCRVLMKLYFSGELLFKKKYENTKFQENPSSGIRGVPGCPSHKLLLYRLDSLTLLQANGLIYREAYSNSNIAVEDFINHL